MSPPIDGGGSLHSVVAGDNIHGCAEIQDRGRRFNIDRQCRYMHAFLDEGSDQKRKTGKKLGLYSFPPGVGSALPTISCNSTVMP